MNKRKINCCGHYTTFTLFSPLFEIMVQINFIRITSISVSRKPFEKAGKKTKLQINKNHLVNINCGSSILAKILRYFF